MSTKLSLKVGASVLALGVLGACSSVPDAANPVEWYRSTVDLFTGDDETQESTAQQPSDSVPGEDESFPSLSSVPENTQVLGGTNSGQGLIADPSKPEYASSISRQTGDDESNILNLQPAPPALPVAPVATAEVLAQPQVQAPEAQASAVTDSPPPEPVISQQQVLEAQVAAVPVVSANQMVIQPGVLPSGESYDEYRARLMAGLEQGASTMSAITTTPPAATMSTTTLAPSVTNSGMGTTLTSGNESNETLIISSTGIRNTSQYTSQYASAQITSGRSNSGFLQLAMENGQPMLSANATRVATVHFTNGSSRLDATDRRVLKQVIALQRQNGGIIQIIGHASSRTKSMEPVRHKMVNYSVSVSRADAIANAMVRLGAPKDSIMIGAVSDSQPLYYEVMPTGEAGNRRAEIYIGS